MVNKRILFSLIIMICVLGLASAGTFAYFDDQQTTAGNSITAGTLKLNTDLTSVTKSITGAYPGDADKAIGTSFNVVSDGGVASQLTAVIPADSVTGTTNMYKDLIIYTRGAGGTICTLYDGSKSGVQPVSTINSYIAPGTNTQTLTLYYTYTKSTTQVQDQGGVFNFKIQFELKQL